MGEVPSDATAVVPDERLPIAGQRIGPERPAAHGLRAFLVVVALLAGYYIVTWAARYLTLDPAVYGARWRFAPLVFLHVGFGIVALTIGPLQFWSGLRRQNMRVHPGSVELTWPRSR